MKNEFLLAFNEVLEEKQLPKEVILDAVQAAMVSAYRRAVNASNAQQVEAVVDPETGKVLIYAEKEVVESVEDDRTEVSLDDAIQVETEAEIGSMVIVETTPDNFGRVAAQTARQVIQQRIREAEREAQHEYFSTQLGEIVSGVVQAINHRGISLGLDMKAEGLMPRNQMIPGERFRVHDRVRTLLLEVKTSPRGPQIILSRSHKNFLRRLLENEVPEIYHGMVEIRSIAREPGHRSKVAVSALQAGVDPVGACVGIRGVRIQAIVRELHDEKIDVIEWNPDPGQFIAKALSPARVSGVFLNEFSKGAKTATVVVPEDQLSLAIGRDGQNARLAAKLTSWRIDIKSLPESATDALHKLQSDTRLAELAESQAEILPQVEIILAKKAEGRPVTPEEYQVLTKFVDLVERTFIQIQEETRKEEEERERIARAGIPGLVFEMPMAEFEVSDRLYTVISGTGYDTVGDLMLHYNLDPDSLDALNGMGPKSWAEFQAAMEDVKQKAQEQELAQKEAEEALALEAEAAEKAAAAEQAEAEALAAEADVPVVEADLEAEAALVTDAVETEEGAGSPEAEQAVEASEEEEETASLEDLFAVDPSKLDVEAVGVNFEDDELETKKEKKKKRKKFVEIEYDPDADVTLVKKKRKRSDELDWEEEWK